MGGVIARKRSQSRGRTYEGSADLDIYALLGVARHAPASLAWNLYWVKMELLQVALERGEPGAARAIEDLNVALTTILDERLRAAYDRAHPPQQQQDEPDPAAGVRPSEMTPAAAVRPSRVMAAAASVPLAAGAALAGWWLAGPAVAGAAGGAGAVLGAVAAAWPAHALEGKRHVEDNPFEALGLSGTPGEREVGIAYEASAHQLLNRMRDGEDVLPRLEQLDRIHASARQRLVERATHIEHIEDTEHIEHIEDTERIERFRETPEGAEESPRTERSSTSPGLERWLGLPGGAPAHTGAVDDGASRDAESAEGSALRPIIVTVDEADAYLVLEAPTGKRRVPVKAAPLRIGSDDDCELVMPAEMGVLPVHATVWRRDGLLWLHAMDADEGACLVNGQPMAWAALDDGDELLVGQARFRIESRPSAPAA